MTHRVSAILSFNMSDDGYSHFEGFKSLMKSNISSCVSFIVQTDSYFKNNVFHSNHSSFLFVTFQNKILFLQIAPYICKNSTIASFSFIFFGKCFKDAKNGSFLLSNVHFLTHHIV